MDTVHYLAKSKKLIFKTVIKNVIKNEDTIKKIYNDNLGLKETIVAINYQEGARLNCVIDKDENG